MSLDVAIFDRAGDAIEFHPSAEQLKTDALALGALVGTVFDSASNEAAVIAMKAIKEIVNLTERTRKVVKEPVLDLCREIDNAAKSYTSDLDAEYKRLQVESADYMTAQLERVRQQEEARRREAERIEAERLAEQRRIEEEARRAAEAVRLKAEAEARAIRLENERLAREAAEKAAAELKAARDKKERAAAIERAERLKVEAAAKAERDRIAAEERTAAEAKRIAEQAERDAQAAAERRQQEMLAMPVIDSGRAKGQTAKPVWKWEVTNIFDLVRLSPGLVDIKPRASEINAAIEAIARGNPEPKIPGLRIWEETQVNVRTSRPGKAIDV